MLAWPWPACCARKPSAAPLRGTFTDTRSAPLCPPAWLPPAFRSASLSLGPPTKPTCTRLGAAATAARAPLVPGQPTPPPGQAHLQSSRRGPQGRRPHRRLTGRTWTAAMRTTPRTMPTQLAVGAGWAPWGTLLRAPPGPATRPSGPTSTLGKAGTAGATPVRTLTRRSRCCGTTPTASPCSPSSEWQGRGAAGWWPSHVGMQVVVLGPHGPWLSTQQALVGSWQVRPSAVPLPATPWPAAHPRSH